MALDPLPRSRPRTARRDIELTFERGDCVAIDGQALSPADLLAELNRIGGENGIGRDDIVENRYVGMKSRGCYETPGGTILLKAHRAMESLTLDRESAHLKDELMPRYASLVYNGYWWSPERLMLQAAIDQTQAVVNGVVRLKLYKGGVLVVGRKSDDRQPVRRRHRHLRGGRRGLQPGRCHRLHPAQCPAAAGGEPAARAVSRVSTA